VGIIGEILLAVSVFEKEHALMKYSFRHAAFSSL
jgi:hypothetical protein